MSYENRTIKMPDGMLVETIKRGWFGRIKVVSSKFLKDEKIVQLGAHRPAGQFTGYVGSNTGPFGQTLTLSMRPVTGSVVHVGPGIPIPEHARAVSYYDSRTMSAPIRVTPFHGQERRP